MPAAAKETVVHVPLSKLKPNPWPEAGPPLAAEDEESLRSGIERDGIQIPLIVWKRGMVVLSGSNRLRIANDLGLKTVPVIIREFVNQGAAKAFAISDNLARRHLTTGQKAYLAFQYQLLSQGCAGRPTKISSGLTKLDARESAADRGGVSEGSLSAIKTIVESGDDDLLQSVLNGTKTLHGAVHAIRSNGRAKKSSLTSDQRRSRIDATTLTQGDCRKELKKIATASVDLVLTDPIYPCVGKPYGCMTEAVWLEMMKSVVAESRRVLKPGGSAVFILQPNLKTTGTMRLWPWRFMLWAAEEWNLVQDCYWWCPNTLPSHAVSRKVGLLRQSVKLCVWLGSSACYRGQENVLWDISDSMAAVRWENRCLQRRPGGQGTRDGRTAEASMERGGSTPFNLLPISAASPGEHVGHPSTTPLALASWWCRYLLPARGVLLDPFCGAGTMLLAGLDNGASRVIGIDKEKRYLAMSKRKIGA